MVSMQEVVGVRWQFPPPTIETDAGLGSIRVRNASRDRSNVGNQVLILNQLLSCG